LGKLGGQLFGQRVPVGFGQSSKLFDQPFGNRFDHLFLGLETD
jgi:hypothetical protein